MTVTGKKSISISEIGAVVRNLVLKEPVVVHEELDSARFSSQIARFSP